jgi:hypothetical protein
LSYSWGFSSFILLFYSLYSPRKNPENLTFISAYSLKLELTYQKK